VCNIDGWKYNHAPKNVLESPEQGLSVVSGRAGIGSFLGKLSIKRRCSTKRSMVLFSMGTAPFANVEDALESSERGLSVVSMCAGIGPKPSKL
jgi:hypothetical protein